MKKIILTTIIAAFALVMLAGAADTHCQVPCGIYGDQMRFSMMREHVQTIEKSTKEINRLSAMEDINYNQLVRWINNKDDHAQQLNDIVTYYFLAQRITPPKDMQDGGAMSKYQRQLILLHHIMLNSMYAKQHTSLEYTEKLYKLIDEFEMEYFGEEMMNHSH